MKLSILAVSALMAVTSVAQAASFQASSSAVAGISGNVIDFNDYDGFNLPQPSITSLNLGSGVTLTSTGGIIVGQNAYDLNDNGAWTVLGDSNRDGNFLSTSFNGSGSIDFSFASAAYQVGIFANQYQAVDQTNNILQAFAYDINGNELESFSLTINTAFDGYDEGMFIGFNRASADIYSFRVTGADFVVDNLTVAAVPEPETYAMFLAGLGFLGMASRRRRG